MPNISITLHLHAETEKAIRAARRFEKYQARTKIVVYNGGWLS